MKRDYTFKNSDFLPFIYDNSLEKAIIENKHTFKAIGHILQSFTHEKNFVLKSVPTTLKSDERILSFIALYKNKPIFLTLFSDDFVIEIDDEKYHFKLDWDINFLYARLVKYRKQIDKKAVIEKINSHNLTIDIYIKDKKFHFFVPYDIDYYLNAYYFSIIRENTSIIEMKNLYLERFFHTQSEYEKKLETVLSIYEIKNGEEVLLDELSLVNGFVTKYLLSTKKEDILLSIKGGIDSEEEITIRNLENVFDLQVSLELQELLQRSRTIMPKNRRLL